MGNNPFVNGKVHTGNILPLWENAQPMRGYSFENKNPLIRRFAELIMQSEYADNWKGLSIKAKLGETAVRDILTPDRTANPGIRTLEKILAALGRDWTDVITVEVTADKEGIIRKLHRLEDAVVQLTTEIRRARDNNKAQIRLDA